MSKIRYAPEPHAPEYWDYDDEEFEQAMDEDSWDEDYDDSIRIKEENKLDEQRNNVT